MARMNKPAPKKEPTIVRSIEYRGYTIARMSDDTFRVYLNAVHAMNVGGVKEAKEQIDVALESRRQPTKGKGTRGNMPTRTNGPHKVITEDLYQRGPYQKNPPESCKWRGQFDGKGPYYVDNVICAFSCGDEDCPTYKELMAGSKERIAKLRKGTED
jgi:hypothetical protein